MSTAFFKITTAFKNACEQAPAICDAVYAERTRPISDELESAVNVQFKGADPTAGAIAGAPIDWRTHIVVDCYARSNEIDGDSPIDLLLQNVFARLAADTTLAGLVGNIGAPLIEADFDAQGQKTGWVQLTYVVDHRTQNLTLD